jgi:hypothetical protein
MVAALGIAASLLTDVGFKALKHLGSSKKQQDTSQAGITGQGTESGQIVPGQGSAKGSAKSSRPDFNQIFAKIDTDGDKSISRQEFLDFKAKIDQTVSSLLKTQEESTDAASQTTGKAKASADAIFSALDTDKNGAVSMEELAAGVHHGKSHQAGGQGHGENGGGSPASFLAALLNIQSQAGQSTAEQTGTAPAAGVAA